MQISTMKFDVSCLFSTDDLDQVEKVPFHSWFTGSFYQE